MMNQKIRQFIESLQDNLSKISVSNPAKKCVWSYALLLLFCCLLYVSGWIFEWVVDGRPNLSEMRMFLSSVTGVAAVAAVTFVAKSVIDMNNNGIPDDFEEKGK